MLKKEDLLHIADISKLYINNSECNLYEQDFNEIVEFVSKISGVASGEKDFAMSGVEVLRDDAVNQEYEPKDVLSNAPCSADGYFVVSKVIE